MIGMKKPSGPQRTADAADQYKTISDDVAAHPHGAGNDAELTQSGRSSSCVWCDVVCRLGEYVKVG